MVLIAMLESGMPLWFRCMLAVGYGGREISQDISLASSPTIVLCGYFGSIFKATADCTTCLWCVCLCVCVCCAYTLVVGVCAVRVHKTRHLRMVQATHLTSLGLACARWLHAAITREITQAGASTT